MESVSVESQNKDAEYIFCVSCGERLNKGSRFCSACGKPVNQVASSNSQRQQEFVGKIYKCPNCGSIITNATAVCPDCGMKISKVQDRNTLREFQEKLIELESLQKGFGILNMYKEIFLGDKNPIEALIKNYPIPDTVDEIVEFMQVQTLIVAVVVVLNLLGFQK